MKLRYEYRLIVKFDLNNSSGEGIIFAERISVSDKKSIKSKIIETY